MLNFITLLVGSSLSSGFNVYLTVLAIGLYSRFGVGSEELMGMIEPFGSWWVLIPAGVLFLCEFIADKVPAFDNVWDVAHTAIRPVGAVFIALALAQDANIAVQIFAAITGGTLALGSHVLKAGVRATARLNPEPVTNSLSSPALSVAEDIAVLAVTAVTMVSPWVAAGVLTALLVLLVWFGPRSLTLFGFVFDATFSRIKAFFQDDTHRDGPLQPVQATFLAHARRELGGVLEPVAKSKVYVKVSGLMNYRHGALIVTKDEVLVVYRQFWVRRMRRIALSELTGVQHRQRWFRDVVTLRSGKEVTHLYFVRTQEGYAQDLADMFESMGVEVERGKVKPRASAQAPALAEA